MKHIGFTVTFILIGLSVTLAVGVMSFLTAMVLEATGPGLDSNLRMALCFGPPIVILALMPVVGATLFLLRRAQFQKNVPSETELVQTLARRANEMSQRLEAVETILLDQSDHYRETVGRSSSD